RVAGYLLALVALAAWIAARRGKLRAVARWAGIAALAVWAQAAWGVLTVMHAAPLALAIVHQAGAVATFALALRARFAA
ncbi:MAG: heme A synthase, partial [Rhodobacterales bacterium CG18_big_fil_WC_8_21_14_2_50_71_9]